MTLYPGSGKTRSKVPIRARNPVLASGATVAESFAALAEAGLEHLTRNAEAFTSHPDPDAVHQMRVAVRRLRALLSAFRSVLPKARRKRIAAELKRLQKSLGPARDLDVFLDEVLPEMPPALARTILAGAARAPHRRAYARVRAALAGPVVRRIGLGFVALVEELRLAPDGARSGQALGRKVLARRHSALVKRLGGAKQRSDERLHALRIRIKKLRYAVEFFRPLMPKGGVRAFHAALAESQDVLGAFNDAVNARVLARALTRRANGLDATARGAMDGVFAAAEKRARTRAQRKFAAQQKALTNPPRRWFR